jgi:hypothetical protein
MLTKKLNAGEHSLEDAFSFEKDGIQGRKVVVRCPYCKRNTMPYLSRKMKTIYADWRWVLTSHKEPYSIHEYTCRCGETFTFTTHVPQ